MIPTPMFPGATAFGAFVAVAVHPESTASVVEQLAEAASVPVSSATVATTFETVDAATLSPTAAFAAALLEYWHLVSASVGRGQATGGVVQVVVAPGNSSTCLTQLADAVVPTGTAAEADAAANAAMLNVRTTLAKALSLIVPPSSGAVRVRTRSVRV